MDSVSDVAIPGLAFRRLRDPSDYAAIAELMTACHLTDGIQYLPTAASLQNDWEHLADFDPHANLLLCEADGRLVGFGEAMRQVRDGVGVYYTFGSVHPEVRRRGLGRAILHANEARLREMAAGFDDAGGRTFASWVDDKEPGARELLTSAGYGPVRHGTTMRLADLSAVAELPLPEGLEMRPVTPDQHRAIFEADDEAFRDHWGHRDVTEEDFVRTFAEPELDTGLWRVAWDGDQVAGSVLAYVWKAENEKLGVQRGWLERISVRRPWRRRGLAKALISSALVALREAGIGEAMLGVDTENLTGAFRLYESVGFVAEDRSTHYRKPFD
jgi:mycothiol synthase